MGRTWSPDAIPDSAHLMPGAYLLEVSEIAETHPRDSEKLMYAFTFNVVEPAQFAGLPYYENCVIGTEDDPDAQDPDTWKTSVGARIMKRILKATGIELVDDVDDCIQAAKGQHVIAIIGEQTDDGSRDPRYKGRVRNNSLGWYAPGEREVGVDGNQVATAPAKPLAKAPSRPAAPARPTAAAPARAAVGGAPTRPAAPPAKSTAPAAKTPVKADAVKCTICGQPVPRAQFVEHVEAHEQEE